MGILKFIIGFIVFILIYGTIDFIATIIPEWVGILFLFGIVVGLVRLMFLIAKKGN